MWLISYLKIMINYSNINSLLKYVQLYVLKNLKNILF